MGKRKLIVVFIIFFAIVSILPGYEADIRIVTGGEIHGDTIDININVTENTTHVLIRRNFTFHSYYEIGMFSIVDIPEWETSIYTSPH